MTAARIQFDLNRFNLAGCITSRFHINQKVVAFPGQDHIVITVQPTFAWTTSNVCSQSRQCGPLVGLRFLTTKCTTHPAHFNGHRRLINTQHFSNGMLNLSWMLCGGVHKHITIFTGNSKGHLPFKIEVLLPTQRKTALHRVRRPFHSGFRCPTAKLIVRQDFLLCFESISDAHQRRFSLNFNSCQLNSLARL